MERIVGEAWMVERWVATLDHYELVEHVTSQPHAEVCRARRLEDGAEVTLKLPGARTRTDWFVGGQWVRECNLTEQLDCDRLVSRCDLGERKSEEYLVFGGPPGPTLRQTIGAATPVPLSRVLRWGAQLAEALAYLHGVGLIHRDVRPDNVYVAAGGVRLLPSGYLEASAGWGRSEPPDPDGPAAPYLPRELQRGDAGDASCDVYSWAVTMQELLGASTVSTDHPATGGGMPGADFDRLEQVLLTASHPSPFQRYPDGVALGDELRRALGARRPR